MIDMRCDVIAAFVILLFVNMRICVQFHGEIAEHWITVAIFNLLSTKFRNGCFIDHSCRQPRKIQIMEIQLIMAQSVNVFLVEPKSYTPEMMTIYFKNMQ